MAFAASFDESNCVLDKPSDMKVDECTVLAVCKTQTESGLPVIISCWKLSKEELDEINATGRVWLGIYGHSMPPVFVDGIKPFANNSVLNEE